MKPLIGKQRMLNQYLHWLPCRGEDLKVEGEINILITVKTS